MLISWSENVYVLNVLNLLLKEACVIALFITKKCTSTEIPYRHFNTLILMRAKIGRYI